MAKDSTRFSDRLKTRVPSWQRFFERARADARNPAYDLLPVLNLDQRNRFSQTLATFSPKTPDFRLTPLQSELHDALRRDGLTSLFYVANWGQVFGDVSYFEQFAPSALKHTWSLAIEEQFYVLWPLLVFGILRLARGSGRLLLGLTATMAAGSALLMYALYKPGFDPCELFWDPKLFAPKLRAARRLVQKKMGFRTIFDVVPLDPSIVRGSHGLAAADPRDRPVLVGHGPNPGPSVPMTGVRDLLLNALGLGL